LQIKKSFFDSPNRSRAGSTRYVMVKERVPSSLKYRRITKADVKFSDGLIPPEWKIEADDNGFLYPSHIHEKPNLKIVFLGGSTTECLKNNEENRFPYRVGRILETAGRKVNSYNCARSGNSSLDSINNLLFKVIPLNPDFVILMHNINDLIILLYEGNYWNNHPTRGLFVYQKTILENSGYLYSNARIDNFINMLTAIRKAFIPRLSERFYYLIFYQAFRERILDHDEWAHIRGKKLSMQTQKITRQFKKNLQLFINICEARNITPVLMTQASRLQEEPDELIFKNICRLFEEDHGISYDELKCAFDTFNIAIRDVGRKNGVPVIDLANSIPPEKEYIYDYVHLTDKGSLFCAEIIAEKLNLYVN
jgi:lysophospholipase L1-like esterase